MLFHVVYYPMRLGGMKVLTDDNYIIYDERSFILFSRGYYISRTKPTIGVEHYYFYVGF